MVSNSETAKITHMHILGNQATNPICTLTLWPGQGLEQGPFGGKNWRARTLQDTLNFIQKYSITLYDQLYHELLMSQLSFPKISIYIYCDKLIVTK